MNTIRKGIVTCCQATLLAVLGIIALMFLAPRAIGSKCTAFQVGTKCNYKAQCPSTAKCVACNLFTKSSCTAIAGKCKCK
jgi:hypothetical protein